MTIIKQLEKTELFLFIVQKELAYVDKMLQILQNNKAVRSQNLYYSPIRIQLRTKSVDVSGKNKNKNKNKNKIKSAYKCLIEERE